MQASAGFIDRIVKFPAGMQCREYQSLRRNTFFMHIYRDPPAIVGDSAGSVPVKDNGDLTAVSCQVLIYGIVYDLKNKMIQPFAGKTADVHTRALANSLQSFQNGYTGGIVGFFFCHSYLPFKSTYMIPV